MKKQEAIVRIAKKLLNRIRYVWKNGIPYCPGEAIYLQDQRAWIDQEKCIGCAQCLVSCPSRNIRIRWDESMQNVQEKICEHVYGITKALHIPVVYINFVM